MRIGVMSDTHDHLANVARIVELLNAADVALTVHTGDVTKPKTLEALSALAMPLLGVYGNNDLERAGLEAAARRHAQVFVDPPLVREWAGRRVVIVHDPLTLEGLDLSATDVALHGHIHRTVDETRGATRVFNPGECAGHLRGHNRVGVVDLAARTMELLTF